MPRADSLNSKNVILGSSWSNPKWCSPAPCRAESTAGLPDWCGHIWDDQLISPTGRLSGSRKDLWTVPAVSLLWDCRVVATENSKPWLSRRCAVVEFHWVPFTLGQVPCRTRLSCSLQFGVDESSFQAARLSSKQYRLISIDPVESLAERGGGSRSGVKNIGELGAK
jgi:hypothetical protein